MTNMRRFYVALCAFAADEDRDDLRAWHIVGDGTVRQWCVRDRREENRDGEPCVHAYFDTRAQARAEADALNRNEQENADG